jgi:hypothetical protein
MTLEFSNCSPNSILFKNDWLYQHNIVCLNYTTYDCRRSQEVIHSSSSHNNIMVLSDSWPDQSQNSNSHPFCYAQVLGVYHANVVYVGPGMVNYQPHWMESLWVQWYGYVETAAGWDSHKLDCVWFPCVTREDVFGFVDPSDVLRSCHIIPAFSKGKLHQDGIGSSRLAKDSSSWAAYYINRCIHLIY